MAYLFNPKCAVNDYLMDSENLAVECSRLDGKITAIIASILVFVVAIILYLKQWPTKYTEDEDRTKPKPRTGLMLYLGVALCCSIILWILLVPVAGFFSKMNWRGTQEKIKSYETAGIAKPDAIRQMQSWAEAQLQADATRQAAATIAASVRASNSKSIN